LQGAEGDAKNARQENAGLENAAPDCNGGNAELENATPICRVGKCRTGKWGIRHCMEHKFKILF